MKENVIKMARLIGRCNDTTCEDCLIQMEAINGVEWRKVKRSCNKIFEKRL